MNKKIGIVLSLIMICFGIVGYHSFSASAQSDGELLENKVNNESEKIDEINEANKENIVSEKKEQDNGEVDTSKDDGSNNKNETINDKKNNIVKRASTNDITNEAELDSALSNASGDVILNFEGGTTINLSKPITINNNNITSIKFKSNNDQSVILKNAADKKHIEVTGDKAIKLSFNKVEIHGSDNLKDGGISIKSNALGNEIDGLVLKDNSLTKWNSGAIQFINTNSNSGLTIKNSKVINNKVSIRGASGSGIVLLDSKKSDLVLDNVEFSNNDILNPTGGALVVYNEGGTTTLKNTTFSNNSMSEAASMNYDARNGSTLNISDTKFIENKNSKGTGAGMRIRHRDTSITNITNTDFIDNYAYRGHGALDFKEEGDSTTTLDNVKMNGNKANIMEYNNDILTGDPSNGGAIGLEQFAGSSKFVIKNSTLNDNRAQAGGAIDLYNDYEGYTNLIIENSIINNNTSDYIGGAINLNLQSENPQDHIYSIKNSELKNNLVTGRDLGPGIHKGGQGGAIEASIIEKYPNALLLDTVNFDNNKSQDPVTWSFNKNQDVEISKIHARNVKDSKFSKTPHKYIEGRNNNAYNGDDVYVGYDGFTYLNGNKDGAIKDLDVTNYPVDGSEVYHKSYIGTSALEPIIPNTKDYKFLGWYEDNGSKFDFNTSVQPDVYLTLYAKYEKIIKHQVTFDLNGASKEENSNMNLSQVVIENELATNPGDALWQDNAAFDGWYLKDENGNLTKKWDFLNDKVVADTMLYAKWLVNVDFSVVNEKDLKIPTFSVERNTKASEVINNMNASLNNNRIRNIKWYTNEELTNEVNLDNGVSRHTKLYGQIIKYQISFDLNSAPSEQNNGIKLNQIVVENELATNPGDALWQDNATFDGWYLKDDKGNLSKKWNFTSDKVIKDTKLYAKWLVDVNFIIVNDKNTKIPTFTIERNTKANDVVKKLNSTIKDNKIRSIKWYTDKDMKTPVSLNSEITKHSNYYGKYSKKIVDPTIKEPKKKVNNKISKAGQDTIVLFSSLFILSGITLGYIRKIRQ